MADNLICTNCGNILKKQWLVCKFCHQPRWKMIMPYFFWSPVFLVGSWWLLTQKLSASISYNDPFSLLLPIIAVTLLIIGVVMLMMALIATVRGLSGRKVPVSQLIRTSSDWYTTAPASLAEAETGHLNAPLVMPSLPASATLTQPEVPKLDKPHEQAIHCQKCSSENKPGATKCSQCGKNLLSGLGAKQRLSIFISSTVLTMLIFIAAILLYRYKPEFGGKDLIYLLGLIGFGPFVFLLGLLLSLQKTPIYERYEMRAKHHVSLNPWQAIADYSTAINSAPQPQAFDYLIERAKLYQGLEMTTEARADWQHALENINSRIATPKASIDLYKQRAEIIGYLGMEDEYALQMLRYTIEKEKTFKTKRKGIAMGWEEGLQKGSEDMQRQELEKIRSEIMANQKYKIIGQCKQCRSMVDLDARLECTNNSKHRNIKNISPTLREADPS